MFGSFLSASLQIYKRFKVQFILGLISLIIGLTGAGVLLLFAKQEFSHDRSFPNAERIYLVESKVTIPGRPVAWGAGTPFVLKDALKKDFPEIKAISHFYVDRFDQIAIFQDREKKFARKSVAVDENFFEVLQLTFLKGSKETALRGPNSIVLTRSTAALFFVEDDPLGQILYTDVNPERPLKVTAVVEDLPETSHLVGDYFFPLIWEDWVQPGENPPRYQDWNSQSARTYFELEQGVNIGTLSDKLRDFEAQNVPADLQKSRPREFKFVALTDIYFHGSPMSAFKPVGNIKVVEGFMVIAAIILLISSFNFANMVLAIYAARTKEMALRKIVGAARSQIISHVAIEVLLIASFALIISISLAELLLPRFNVLFFTALEMDILDDPLLFAGGLSLVAAVAVVSGLFPAVGASSVMPASILSGAEKEKPKRRFFRSAILTIQFAIATGLIPITLIVFAQLDYVQNKDVGYRKDGLLVVRDMIRSEIRPNLESLEQNIRDLPGVTNIAMSLEAPGDLNINFGFALKRTDIGELENSVSVKGRMVGFDYFETYDVKPILGRTFSRAFSNDSLMKSMEGGFEPDSNLILNLGAVKALGFASPEEALGKTLFVDIGNGSNATIIGIIPDLPFTSLKKEIGPEAYVNLGPIHSTLTIAYETDDFAGLIAAIEDIWVEAGATVPLGYSLVSENWNKAYKSDRLLGNIFAAFAVLAVLVSMAGIYSLTLFETSRRRHEIGIRKALGGSALDILKLLLFQASKPVLLAIIIALPVAFLLANAWLEGFGDRIFLNPLYFLGTGLATLVISWITVGGHALQAARQHPGHILRYE